MNIQNPEPQYISLVKIVSVIEVKLIRGTGESPTQIQREVTQYWDPSGKLLAEIDSCPGGIPEGGQVEVSFQPDE